MRRTLGVVVVVLGLVFVAGAGVVRWVAAPQLAQLPGDTNTTRTYSGNAAALFNPTVTTGTMVGPGVLRDVPVQITHNDTVVETDGHSALVDDSRVVTMPGFTVADLSYAYGVDRRTFQPVGTFPDAVKTEGLTFNWPMDTQQHDYTGWVQDTLSTTSLHFVGEVRHGDIATYQFTAAAAARPITDPVIGQMLPASMSKSDLLRLTPSLQLSNQQLLALDKLLQRMPDPVPLTYTYAFDATFWIAPDSGLVVDMKQHETRAVAIVDGTDAVPVSPIMDMTYAFTPSTVSGAAGEARDAVDKLRLVRVTVPVAALVLGAVLVLVGTALLTGPRRPRPVEVDDETIANLVEPREHIGV